MWKLCHWPHDDDDDDDDDDGTDESTVNVSLGSLPLGHRITVELRKRK